MELLMFVQTIQYIIQTASNIEVAGFIFNILVRSYVYILVILLVPASIFVFVLLFFHLFMIGSNQTTN